jgi:hypothetical protein
VFKNTSFVVLKVEEKLAELEKVKDPQALMAAFKSLGVDLMSLAKLSGARQAVSFMGVDVVFFITHN